jgi:hypothetical protein
VCSTAHFRQHKTIQKASEFSERGRFVHVIGGLTDDVIAQQQHVVAIVLTSLFVLFA